MRRYIENAQGAGVHRGDGVEAVDDGLIGAVADAVRPDGHGAAWEQLSGFEDQITAWVAGEGKAAAMLQLRRQIERCHGGHAGD